jgi:NAD(P)-dependent dehydrogenase (short-subunit alcohol dehydrogenase family)
VATAVGVYGSTKAALNRITNAFAVELHGRGVRINTVEPRAAVLSEGADELVGSILSDDQIESMEAMVESILLLSTCPVDHTGRVDVSLDLLDAANRTVMSLDGASAHPTGQRIARR